VRARGRLGAQAAMRGAPHLDGGRREATRFETASCNYRETTYVQAVTTAAQTSLPSETVTLGPEGQVRLPDRLRHLLGWQEGDKLVMTADDRGDVKTLTVHDPVCGARGMLSARASGQPRADELIEERRREAGST
jgi:bifunctional DNA-binding transcriptional regulator/antitoxin component of YhaV-PrlF toxin-antitoxin module